MVSLQQSGEIWKSISRSVTKAVGLLIGISGSTTTAVWVIRLICIRGTQLGTATDTTPKQARISTHVVTLITPIAGACISATIPVTRTISLFGGSGETPTEPLQAMSLPNALREF